MAVDFTDIDKNLPDGQNMGGIPQLVYFALPVLSTVTRCSG